MLALVAEKMALLKWKKSLTSYSSISSINTWTEDSLLCEDWEGVYCTDGQVFRL